MSWGELMVIGGVALIVIGPKDLPKALRTVGQVTSKVRRLAGEFQAQFNEAMREAELDDVKRDLENINRDVRNSTATAFNPIQTIRDEIKTSVESRPATITAPAEPSHESIEVSSPETAVASAASEHGTNEPPQAGDAKPDAVPADRPPAITAALDKAPVAPVEVTPLTEVAGPGLEGAGPVVPGSIGDRSPDERHAEAARHEPSRRTQNGGASFETQAAPAPQDDEGGRSSSNSQRRWPA